MEIVIANVLGQPAATCQEASGIHVIPVTWTYVEAGLGKPLSDNYAEGWSDIALFFAIFENGHYAADQVYCFESNYEESWNMGARARKSFHF